MKVKVSSQRESKKYIFTDKGDDSEVIQNHTNHSSTLVGGKMRGRLRIPLTVSFLESFGSPNNTTVILVRLFLRHY